MHDVLDLGAGTGLLAARVAAAHPGAALTLVDGAPRMLDRARERLGERAAYRTGDLLDPLPGDGWDAVVSALAIHHLDVPDVAVLSGGSMPPSARAGCSWTPSR